MMDLLIFIELKYSINKIQLLNEYGYNDDVDNKKIADELQSLSELTGIPVNVLKNLF